MTSANSMESRSKILSARKTGTAPLEKFTEQGESSGKKAGLHVGICNAGIVVGGNFCDVGFEK